LHKGANFQPATPKRKLEISGGRAAIKKGMIIWGDWEAPRGDSCFANKNASPILPAPRQPI
jgi:hypothetical protein